MKRLTIDKIVRFALGLAIFIVGIAYESWLGIFGIVPIISALTGACPIMPCSGSSCKINQSENNQKTG